MRFFICLFLLFLACTSVLTKGSRHSCVHEKISAQYPILEEGPTSAEENRLLQNNNLRPLKIHIDTSKLKTLPQELHAYLTEKIVPVAFQFLSKRIQVANNGQNLTLTSRKCRTIDIPEEYKSVGVDADLIIFVTATDEPEENFMAWASSCVRDRVTGRPIVGQINYNIPHISTDIDEFESQVDVTLHEIIHVLAFSKGLYGAYRKGFNSPDVYGESNIIKRVVLRGRERTLLSTPKVMEIARTYYGCQGIQGMEVEDDGQPGTVGSHWERTVMNNEIMIPTNVKESSFSVFTMALLEDSGWYKLDYSKAEPIFYGLNAGCHFLEQGCVNSTRREFCNKTLKVPMCSFNFKHKGYCDDNKYSEGCSYPTHYGGSNCENILDDSGKGRRGETYGPGSKCVIGNVIQKRFRQSSNSSLCYKYQCNNGVITFLPSAGGEIVCTSPGAYVRASDPYVGGLICPDPADYCKDYYPDCPNSCSAKGYCVGGVCECRAGFSGVDCSKSEATDN